MKPPRVLVLSITSMLLAPMGRAATDTWDGEGGNGNLSTALNWLDNSTPASDLANTNLIFAGGNRLAPNVSVAFSAHSITFDNTAGAFVVGGQPLRIGLGGVVNNDTQTQTFGMPVSVGAATSTFNAANGELAFANALGIGTSTLTLAGAHAFRFADISGVGTLNKRGSGPMSWAAWGTNQFDFNINAGTVSTALDNSTDVFHATGSIAVNGTSALLLKAPPFTLVPAPSTVTVPPLAFVPTSKAPALETLPPPATWSAAPHRHPRAGRCAGRWNGLGTRGTQPDCRWQWAHGQPDLSNQSRGTFTAIGLAPDATPGGTGIIRIESGANVTAAALGLAVTAGGNTGDVTVTGAGSKLTARRRSISSARRVRAAAR